MAQPGLGKNQDPTSKITTEKRAGDVVQAVGFLPSKHKALNSKPSTTPQKTKPPKQII
jgi:hypothetical protein